MLSLFTLPSSQFQQPTPSNLGRGLSTPGGDAGCFSWGDTVCWGWVTSTYTNFPAVPPVSLHCPHPIKISTSDIFQPLPAKPPKTGVRHAHCCLSLGLLHIGNRQIPSPEQLSVQVILPNWTTAATTSEKSCSDSSNSHETRWTSPGWSSSRVFYSSRETGLEMMENITRTLWQH